MIFIRITESGPTPRGMRRTLNFVIKEVWHTVGVYWHKTFREKHFTRAGAREYGYEPRKGERSNQASKGFRQSYTGRKLRYKGHTDPLVYSGDSKRATRRRDVRATRNGCRVVLHAPRFNFKPPNSRINMRAEMTRVSLAEERQLIRVFDWNLQQGLDKYRLPVEVRAVGIS